MKVTKYKETTGYTDINNSEILSVKKTALIVKKITDKCCLFSRKKINSIFIAGCGDGKEVFAFNDIFKVKVIGVDISLAENFKSNISGNDIELIKDDLLNIKFPNNYFSMIFSYHVLEHLPNHKKVLQTLSTILETEGILFIGFPNRNRLVGYIGTNSNVSIVNKIAWNLNDYWMRLKGKFENSSGAHAGFTEQEFINDASQFFSTIISVRNDYMLYKYVKYTNLINLLIKSKVAEFIFPSNYFVCIK